MLKTVEKVLLLQDVDIFRLATTDHLARLAAVARELSLPPRHTIFRRGDPSSRLYLVVDGQVRLENDNGRAEVVQRSGLDFLSVFSETPHALEAETLTGCSLLHVHFDDLVELLTAEAGFCWAILRFLGRLGLEQVTRCD